MNKTGISRELRDTTRFFLLAGPHPDPVRMDEQCSSANSCAAAELLEVSALLGERTYSFLVGGLILLCTAVLLALICCAGVLLPLLLFVCCEIVGSVRVWQG